MVANYSLRITVMRRIRYGWTIWKEVGILLSNSTESGVHEGALNLRKWVLSEP